jgi:hypothetical protein
VKFLFCLTYKYIIRLIQRFSLRSALHSSDIQECSWAPSVEDYDLHTMHNATLQSHKRKELRSGAEHCLRSQQTLGWCGQSSVSVESEISLTIIGVSQWSLSQFMKIWFIFCHHIYLIKLSLLSYLRLCLPSCIFPADVSTKTVHALFFSSGFACLLLSLP